MGRPHFDWMTGFDRPGTADHPAPTPINNIHGGWSSVCRLYHLVMAEAHNDFHHRRSSMLQRRPSPLVPPNNGNMYDTLVTPTRPTSLPYYRILPLLIARLAEGMTYTIIFPYINDMIHSFGVKEQDVGYYAGLVVSSKPFRLFS